MTVVGGGDQLRARLRECVLLDERQRERVPGVTQRRVCATGDCASADVVVQPVAVLEEERDVGDEVLRQVGDRNDEQRTRMIGDPGVVALEVGLFAREVDTLVGELAVPTNRLREPRLDVGIGRRPVLWQFTVGFRVATRQEVGTRVVGEEELGGVKPGRGRECSARCGARVVRQRRRVSGVVADPEVPAGHSGDSGEHDRALGVAERLNRFATGESQFSRGDFTADRETA